MNKDTIKFKKLVSPYTVSIYAYPNGYSNEELTNKILTYKTTDTTYYAEKKEYEDVYVNKNKIINYRKVEGEKDCLHINFHKDAFKGMADIRTHNFKLCRKDDSEAYDQIYKNE